MTLPDDVEETMADLAVVFHWAPRDMDPMSPEELAGWRERARRRTETEDE